MAKQKEQELSRFETTNGVAKKIYKGIQKGAIIFGDVEENSSKDLIVKNWVAKPLPNGAVVSFGMTHKQGRNANGRPFNPRYKIRLKYNDNIQEFSGTYARKIYNRLISPPRKRITMLTEETVAFCTNALSDI